MQLCGGRGMLWGILRLMGRVTTLHLRRIGGTVRLRLHRMLMRSNRFSDRQFAPDNNAFANSAHAGEQLFPTFGGGRRRRHY